jgi:hypothetical protein
MFGVGLAITAMPATAATDCALRQITSLPANFVEDRVRVPVLIQDKPVDLVIDTASSRSVLFGRFVDELGPPLYQIQRQIVSEMNQRTNIGAGPVQVKLGRATINGAYFAIMDATPADDRRRRPLGRRLFERLRCGNRPGWAQG